MSGADRYAEQMAVPKPPPNALRQHAYLLAALAVAAGVIYVYWPVISAMLPK
jgi:hypothetical protein